LDVFFRICAFRVYICRILRAKREIVPWLLVIWVLNPKKEVILIAQKKTLPDKDTKVYKLLEMIGIFGEFPTALLSRLNVGKGYEEKMVSSLKRHGLIRTHYEDGRRGLRLTTIGKRFLLAENPNRFEFYLSGYSDTNKVRCDPHRRDRLHRIAEASVTMSNAGVSIFRDERPAIFSPSWEGGEWIRAPAFYTSREIKESGSTFSKIKGARAIGVMLTPYNIFITYNLGSSLMKWRYRAEMRNKALIQNMLCLERMPKQYSPNCICAILLADSMEFAQKILENKIEQYIFKAFTMYRVASKKDYEIVEGTCSAIVPKLFPKFRKIKITDDEGNETTLLLSKQSKVSIGERYRFYFKKTTRVTLGNEYFDSALSSDCFLGYEPVVKQ